MNVKRLWLTALLLVLFGAITMVGIAQESEPAESPEDNACYAGGSLEGKCDWPTDAEDEWAWTCGWYIARVENGGITLAGVPAWCNYFVDTTVCYDSAIPDELDFMLTGPLNTLNNATGYLSTDGSCSGTVYPDQATVVTAAYSPAGEAAAAEKCAALTGDPDMGAGHLMERFGYNTPETWWGCVEGAPQPT